MQGEPWELSGTSGIDRTDLKKRFITQHHREVPQNKEAREMKLQKGIVGGSVVFIKSNQ